MIRAALRAICQTLLMLLLWAFFAFFNLVINAIDSLSDSWRQGRVDWDHVVEIWRSVRRNRKPL